MRLDVYHHSDADQKLDVLIGMINQLLHQEKTIMASLDDIEAAVAAQTTVEQSAVTLLTSLHEQLTAALATQDTAKIQAVLDQLAANTTALSTAIAANTPAAPPVDPNQPQA